MAPPQYYNYIYSDIWKDKSKVFKKLFLGRCVLFPWLKGKHSHHLTYNNFQNEVYWVDCLPLSETAHALIHLPFLWKIRVVRGLINLYLRIAAIVLFPLVAIGLASFKVGDIICLKFCPQLYIGSKKRRKKLKPSKFWFHLSETNHTGIELNTLIPVFFFADNS